MNPLRRLHAFVAINKRLFPHFESTVHWHDGYDTRPVAQFPVVIVEYSLHGEIANIDIATRYRATRD